MKRSHFCRPAQGANSVLQRGDPVARDSMMRGAPRAALELFLAVVLGLSCGASGSDYNLATSYENLVFSPGPPMRGYTNYYGAKPSLAFYSGHILGNTNATSVPTDGQRFRLEGSAIGQPARMLQSDFFLGGFVSAPPGTDTNQAPANFVPVQVGNNPVAYWQEPNGGAFWVPSTRQIICAQPNAVTIDWLTLDGKTNRQVINVDAVPLKRPARLFWTEDPYLAPAVNMSGLFPAIHYNSQVPPPVLLLTTNQESQVVTTNILAGVWLDGQKQLRAKGVTGTFLIEYYQTGTYENQVQPVGVEVVQVMPPHLQLMTADVGTRLMPLEQYWAQMDGVNGVIPNVTRGLNDTVYVHGQNGPKYNWAYAIRRTGQEPWSLEIYWQHKGIMGILWPYEVNWFSCDWPASPQLFVLGNTSTDQAPALIPSELKAEVQSDMDPPLHAKLSVSGRALSTTSPGTCLVKYTTHDDVWFEVVRTVKHDNPYFFDLEPREWPIGEELTPGENQTYAMGFDGQADYVSAGQSWINQQTNWSVSINFKLGEYRQCTLYSEGTPSTTFHLSLTPDKQIQIATWNANIQKSTGIITPPVPLQTSHWHYLTVTYSGGSDTNGTVRVYLDDVFQWQTNHLPREFFSSHEFSVIGAKIYGTGGTPLKTTDYLYGKIDQLRIWNRALTPDQVRLGKYRSASDTLGNLVASFQFNEGQGPIAYNSAGDKHATAGAGAFWCYGQVVPGAEWSGYPGFIHLPWGKGYNVGRYNYPSEANQSAASWIFGVNTGQLEAWWAHQKVQPGMPPVYYPSQVVRYTNTWPTTTPEIVIASGLGHEGDMYLPAADALYFNGSDTNYATASYNSRLDVGSELTLEAWVNLADTAADQRIVSWIGVANNTNYAGYTLGVSGGTVDATFWTGLSTEVGTSNVIKGHGTVPNNRWTHIAYSFRAEDAVVVYVDGKPAWTNAVGSRSIKPSTADLTIGRGVYSGIARNTHGSVGEVRIWNIARTAEEIADTFRTRIDRNAPGLVAYYPFVHGDDSSLVADAGPYGIHASIGAPGTPTTATWVSPGRPVQTSETMVFGAPSIYYQNNKQLHGYNPNEEHALVLGGTVYALRNDLNTPNSSPPYVLLDYLDPWTARPRMQVFSVVQTNELYAFHRTMKAGLPIVAPQPLGGMPPCRNTTSDQSTRPPAWEDRKETWWAVSAGSDGGPADAIMRFWYQVQPGFWFPEADVQPALGTEVPWLPTVYTKPGTSGEPVPVVYTITWPDAPKIKLGQTLTMAYQGLPEIWGQLSVDVVYEQAGKGNSVDLFDPVVSHSSPLAKPVVDSMITARIARKDTMGSYVRFPGLAPSLYERLYWDPNRGLVLQGRLMETLTGPGYLLLNMLEGFEKGAVE
jgi:hypothetical protein